MTKETLQRAKRLAADMELLAEDAENVQAFIDDPEGHEYFVSFDGGNFRTVIPKAVLTEALKVIRKGIINEYLKLKQEFESL